ncbi:MAG TPA: hypothetical protein VFR03_15210 [Thermoanaerobaculia bacterium]|nr:hypothetical protein [Thermoanaerobaculia bacterium]
MTQRNIRCTAAALAAVLTLAAPAQAASHPRASAHSGWIEAVWQWMTGGWEGGGLSDMGGGGQIDGTKSGYGIDPNGSVVTQPADPVADQEAGIGSNG